MFSTEVPSFWDTTQLTHLLRAEGVEVNAQAPSAGPSLLSDFPLGFGPMIFIEAIVGVGAARPGTCSPKATMPRRLQGGRG